MDKSADGCNWDSAELERSSDVICQTWADDDEPSGQTSIRCDTEEKLAQDCVSKVSVCSSGTHLNHQNENIKNNEIKQITGKQVESLYDGNVSYSLHVHSPVGDELDNVQKLSINEIFHEIIQLKESFLKNMGSWIATSIEAFAEKLHVFTDECSIKGNGHDARFEIFKENDVSTLIETAVYVGFYASIAETENILLKSKFRNVKLLVYLSLLLEYDNFALRNLLGRDNDIKWYIIKIKLLKKAIKKLAKENPKDIKYAYLLVCSLEMKDERLQKGVEKHLTQSISGFSSLAHKIKVVYGKESNSIESCTNTVEDGRVYDRARDPPGQRSVYIPPGDPVKESYRLSTFIKFPQETPVNPSNLAKVGFYYTGYKDRVKCFSCGLCVEDWTLGDDVKSSRWHRNDCQMMKGEECGNVPIGGIFARFVNQGGQHAVAPAGNLATESRQASGASKSNVSESHANLPVGSTARPAGEVLNSGPRRREPAQTARPIRQPPPSTNYQRVELATIPSVHHEQLVRSLDLRREADRMRSFSNWALETRTVYPSDLARSGFFYLGNLDRVQCFSCGGVLRNWNYGDNVHAEHRRHFPNCRMVQGTDGRNISIPPGDRLAPPDRPAVFREPPDPSETEQRELQSNFPCLYPVSPHMRNEDSRFETFDHRWPQSRVRATPRQIAKAGFFFLGERDRVKCWYCNGGLQNWDPDDEPWSEHAKWFPTCEFLLQRKGPDFVHRMVSLFPNLPRPVLRGPFDVPPSGSRGRGQRQPSPPPPIIDPQVEMQRVRSQLSDAMESSIVRNAVEMGFDRQVIRRLIKRRFENRNEMYHSVNNLIEDLTHSPPSDHSDTDEDCSDTERTPSVPTNIKRPGGSETREQNGEATGEPVSLVSTGQQDTAQETEEPMDAEISMPEGATPSMEARIRELQEERKCKICLDRMADVVFVPCGHLCSCTECAQALRKCPICRMKIEKSIRTYMS
ncbi:baculoviral IAP repeat-containing protein 2-like [Clavelina lepadiformis]|uniref:baculoviral IAP repeat-containing protein 2-like n=1 Tax=Clavelina lepadiformis TaxID=159417 RepID=UPI004043260A